MRRRATANTAPQQPTRNRECPWTSPDDPCPSISRVNPSLASCSARNDFQAPLRGPAPRGHNRLKRKSFSSQGGERRSRVRFSRGSGTLLRPEIAARGPRPPGWPPSSGDSGSRFGHGARAGITAVPGAGRTRNEPAWRALYGNRPPIPPSPCSVGHLGRSRPHRLRPCFFCGNSWRNYSRTWRVLPAISRITTRRSQA